MPIIAPSTYTPPWYFKQRHLHTIFPSLCRNVRRVAWTRERLDTPDGDFIDLDWARGAATQLVIAIHGLEGSSRSKYIPGLMHAFRRRGWDGVAYNLRSCSGEPNRLLRFYHAGDSADLETVVRHVLTRTPYTQVALVGFSIGGNILLKYLGEQGAALPSAIRAAAAISAPCDLASSAEQLSTRANRLYLRQFLESFRAKIRTKMCQFPGQISDAGFDEITSFKTYDDRYTAPLHGFANATDYWAQCSAKPWLPAIRIPTLLLSALDDPFLSAACYPFAEAQQNAALYLETPDFGGHVGFVARHPNQEYWHETRITAFVQAS